MYPVALDNHLMSWRGTCPLCRWVCFLVFRLLCNCSIVYLFFMKDSPLSPTRGGGLLSDSEMHCTLASSGVLYLSENQLEMHIRRQSSKELGSKNSVLM